MEELKEIADRLQKKADKMYNSNIISEIDYSIGMQMAVTEVWKYAREIILREKELIK